jgi:ABC-type lipoprotein export system ATPase subunit
MEGHTIVLITHEENLAAQARRMVRLSDGKIISDSEIRNERQEDRSERAENRG